MFQVSQDFAPPFKLIAPFFIVGSLFYFLSAFFLFFVDVDALSYMSSTIMAFLHLFLLGFVMMTIFGAMAQLVPVVLEVGHAAVELFYAIWPLLLVGTSLMFGGFLLWPALLPYGGVVVLISMMIFVLEIFATIKKVKKLNIVMSSVLLSNTFLFIGIIIGLIMALGYAGAIEVDISSLLRAHVFLVIGGYISITVMGLSVVLLPMFGLSHGFSLKPLKFSLYLMSFGVVAVLISSLFNITYLGYFGYILALLSLAIYFYQVYVIYKTRARKENDIYVLSLIFSYVSLAVSLLLLTLYLFSKNESLLMAAGWLIFFGFFAFAITGHIYKIVPFLVWFERFSPLVGKQKVPMLVDMLPKRSSQAQLVFCAIGVVLITIAILLHSSELISAGASFLVVGALAFMRSLIYMINFK
ncbi:hypothetical protein [Sulfurimonas sp.]